MQTKFEKEELTMKKRILAMLLAGTMVFGLAACGGGDDKKP